MRMNSQLIESLNRHLNEDASDKLEAIIRKLLSEEQAAASSYMKAAHKVRKGAEEHNDKTGLKIASVLDDIAKEEKVHIGELNKLLKLIGVSNQPELDGEKEATEELEGE